MQSEDHPISIVQTTLDDADLARNLSRRAIELGLAACVQTHGPVRSCYRWQDRLEEAEEWLLVFKTAPETGPRLVQWLVDEHPYDLPEILCSRSQASAAYAAWVREQTCRNIHHPPTQAAEEERE